MVGWLLVWLALARGIQFSYRLKPLGVQCFTELIGTAVVVTEKDARFQVTVRGNSS